MVANSGGEIVAAEGSELGCQPRRTRKEANFLTAEGPIRNVQLANGEAADGLGCRSRKWRRFDPLSALTWV